MFTCMYPLRTEIEIFPHDELGTWCTHAQFRKRGRRDAERVHIGRQVTASLSRTRHQVILYNLSYDLATSV